MPTIDIPGKVCPHCGGTKWKTEYKKSVKDPNIKTLIYRCAVRGYERTMRWKAKNPDRNREHNIMKCKRRRMNGYYQTPKERERSRLRSKMERDTLHDNYVYRRFMEDPFIKDELKRSDIPPELIELKRKELMLLRKIK